MTVMERPYRIWKTADGRYVGDGHPDAAVLAAGPADPPPNDFDPATFEDVPLDRPATDVDAQADEPPDAQAVEPPDAQAVEPPDAQAVEPPDAQADEQTDAQAVEPVKPAKRSRKS